MRRYVHGDRRSGGPPARVQCRCGDTLLDLPPGVAVAPRGTVATEERGVVCEGCGRRQTVRLRAEAA